jgi:phosphatidylglycerol:prolipoprotein diacylglycerol transferase
MVAAVALGALFPVARDITDPWERRTYRLLQALTFLGGVVGAKLSVVFGETMWPFGPAPQWRALLWSGRSITGALIGGLLFAEAGKLLTGYRRPPNDRFAALVPFSVAVGRVGCFFDGCCRGVPWDGWCAVRYSDGVPRHPAQLYEIAFHLCAGVSFIYMARRGILFGRLFSVYLVAYGVFRFATEFVRETPKRESLAGAGPVSGYQVLAVVMVVLGAAFFVKRTAWPPREWEAYRPRLAAAGSGGEP